MQLTDRKPAVARSSVQLSVGDAVMQRVVSLPMHPGVNEADHSDINELRYGVSPLRNPLLEGHAFHILPYQGLGTGIPRVAQAWENIELQDNPAANQFKATVQRPLPSPAHKEKAESKAESLEIRVLTALQNGALSKVHIAEALGLRKVTGQLNEQVRALLGSGHIEMTLPEKTNSRLQQYRLTQVGRQVLATAHKPTA